MTGVRKIGILGHVGNENLGDEAIIAAVIQNIKCRDPYAQIYGFTSNPEDTEKRHKIAAFPVRRINKRMHYKNTVTGLQSSGISSKVTQQIKITLKAVPVVYGFLKGLQKIWHIFLTSLREPRFLIQCYGNLKGIDLLIIAGSQQLIDYVGGPWAFPYTLFKWVLLAKAVKTKVAFVSVGAGPIHSPLGKFFARKSLALASYRSYRDETSRAFVETLGVSGQNSVFPDLVYSLQIEASSTNGFARTSLPIVGINPVPFSDDRYWLGANSCQYERYVGELGDFALWVIQRGYRVLFFPTQLHLDPPVITDIKNVLEVRADRDLGQNIVDKPICSFDDLVSAICMTDIVVATRYHGIVVPYVLNRPVLGIAYQRKSVDLMAQMGQAEYVVDINSFDADSLKTRFVSLESRFTAIKDEIQQRNSAFRQALQNQYDHLLGLV
jgi:polysaccharide pyruvyl transferase WcaK-like protein